MASIKHEAKMVNGRSRQCEKCPFGDEDAPLNFIECALTILLKGLSKGLGFSKRK
jgi:hypothetical protein